MLSIQAQVLGRPAGASGGQAAAVMPSRQASSFDTCAMSASNNKKKSSGKPVRFMRGFTLIELMIVLVIVGVLAAVAYPSFVDSVRKGRRTDAMAALNALQLAQERWRSNNPVYADNAQLNLGVTATPPGLGLSPTTANGHYTVTIGAASATGYIATAVAIASSSQAADGNCARVRVRVDGGNIFYGSAPATGDSFDEGSSNRCWAR